MKEEDERGPRGDGTTPKQSQTRALEPGSSREEQGKQKSQPHPWRDVATPVVICVNVYMNAVTAYMHCEKRTLLALSMLILVRLQR
ncbi:hypothetical protein NDU88_004309 [Pleurodeles waltl]|uniref:Uncharacterized protein n=1 Tax=Pleurodeles waltl TaxID=8319 RepID=A0AAV7KXE4_PLEWA|nr:hypothetical protein NDU88_004309 [Pleurodeles waltl]